MVLLDGLCRNMAGRVRRASPLARISCCHRLPEEKAKEGKLTCDLRCDWPHAVLRVKQFWPGVLIHGEISN